MIPLITPEDYTFYKCNKHDTYSAFYDPLASNIGNLWKEKKNNIDIKTENVTHLIYGEYHPMYNEFFTSLINLEFICVCEPILLNKIDFNCFPNLKTVFLNFCHITDKGIYNLTNNIETLYFDIHNESGRTLANTDFLFDNLPSNLKKIIFCCAILNKINYAKTRLIIINKIKKYKIPFECKVYFFAGNINSYIEESIF